MAVGRTKPAMKTRSLFNSRMLCLLQQTGLVRRRWSWSFESWFCAAVVRGMVSRQLG